MERSDVEILHTQKLGNYLRCKRKELWCKVKVKLFTYPNIGGIRCSKTCQNRFRTLSWTKGSACNRDSLSFQYCFLLSAKHCSWYQAAGSDSLSCSSKGAEHEILWTLQRSGRPDAWIYRQATFSIRYHTTQGHSSSPSEWLQVDQSDMEV